VPKTIPADTTTERFWPWFVRDQQWARAGLPLALILGLLGPIIRPALGKSRFLIFLHSPVYMLHQFEEHGHGAFKADAQRMFPQARGLTDLNICIVNIGVWGINLGAFNLARFHRLALSLIAPYVAVVNGLLHLAVALRQRRYNPGLVTGAALLLPLGGMSLRQVARESQATRRDHLLGFGGAVLLHLLTIVAIMFIGKKKTD
jgi:hypothetical protein